MRSLTSVVALASVVTIVVGAYPALVGDLAKGATFALGG